MYLQQRSSYVSNNETLPASSESWHGVHFRIKWLIYYTGVQGFQKSWRYCSRKKKQTPETEGGSASYFKVMDSALQCTETNLEYKQGTSQGFGIKKFEKRLKYFVENFLCH